MVKGTNSSKIELAKNSINKTKIPIEKIVNPTMEKIQTPTTFNWPMFNTFIKHLVKHFSNNKNKQKINKQPTKIHNKKSNNQ